MYLLTALMISCNNSILINCLFRRTDNLEIMNKLVKLCNLWETNLIYANHFMDFLRKKIQQRINSLSSFDSVKLNEDKKSDINLVSNFPICKDNLLIDLQEENIK